MLTVAHRAGNDLAALRRAAGAGVDLVEADVHAYRRRLEVRHAKSLGVLPWRWDRWYLVPAGAARLDLATLAAAAADLPDGTELMLDLKGWQPWLGRWVRDAMERVAPGRPYAVCGRRWGMLDAFAGRPHVRRIYSAGTPRELRRLADRLRAAGGFGASVKGELLVDPRHARAVAAARDAVAHLLTWPVNDEATLAAVARAGATGVISDELRLLQSIGGRAR